MVHIFPFSSRKGTEAAKMKGQIYKSEKARRLHELEKIAKDSRMQILSGQIKKEPLGTNGYQPIQATPKAQARGELPPPLSRQPALRATAYDNTFGGECQ